jgi:hypothetical protein
MVKYLGEMYNYRVVDSIIIFRTLYLLITYGVNLDGNSMILFFYEINDFIFKHLKSANLIHLNIYFVFDLFVHYLIVVDNISIVVQAKND